MHACVNNNYMQVHVGYNVSGHVCLHHAEQNIIIPNSWILRIFADVR